jgi:PAS domain S-box-containing protein
MAVAQNRIPGARFFMITVKTKKQWAGIFLVLGLYFAAARWGLHLRVSTSQGFVAPIWPAAGVGLALAILFGWRIWPGLFISALLFNLSEDRPLELGLQIALTNTLEAVLPAMLLSKFDFRPTLDRLRDCVAIWLALHFGAALSATLGTLTLSGMGLLSLQDFNAAWFTWFFSNSIGNLIVGCLMLTWSRAQATDWNLRRLLEMLALLAATLIAVRFIFFERHDSDLWMPYWFFPIIVWAAIRFGPQGSTLISMVIGMLAIWGTLNGSGYFQSGSALQNIIAVQSFIGIVAATSLLLASAVRARRSAEQTLRESEASMVLAQRIAHFGSWELDLTNLSNPPANPLRWSEECYRIFGLEPNLRPVTNDLFFSRVHPDDRESIARAIARAISDHAEYSLTHRLILPHGETRYVHAQAQIFLHEQTGRPWKMIGTVHDITEVQRNEARMRESEERYRLLADNATDMISRLNTLGVFLYVSPACKQQLGYDPEELLGRDVYTFLHPDDVASLRQSNRLLLDRMDIQSITYRFRRRDDSYVWVEATARGLSDPHTGKTNELICISRDITERRSLESQLQQAQKMDAIGQLAGGVAHDFNNLLTVISGYVGLILADLPKQHSARDAVMEIHKAADRAAALTRQLLAFSRRAMLDPKVVDLNALVTDSEKMVRRLIGEDIEFTTAMAANLWRVKVDRTQIDQVILNFVVNARDAMPQGGKLTIETANVVLDENYIRNNAEARPGPHVMLAISDSGHGMSREVLDHIFEPFFTTKGLGKGTGLGLATAYGIVKQSGGHITVYSEVGVGSSFKIYLPSVSDAVTQEKAQPPDLKQLVPGRGTILLVEDEEAVRIYAERVLFDCGYRVLTASNGEEAIRVAEKFLKDIDGLVTDVVMPRMSGRQVAEHLRAKKPNLKILFMSGYTDDAVLRHGVLSAESAFLQKPFSAVTLSQKVHDVMMS